MVLLVMGLCIGLASSIVQSDSRTVLNAETEKLAQRLELAMTEARLTGTPIAWTTDGTQYRFWTMSPHNEWSELTNNELLRSHSLPSGMSITRLDIENIPAPDGMRLAFTPYGPAQSFSIQLSMDDVHHRVQASPLGEITILQEATHE